MDTKRIKAWNLIEEFISGISSNCVSWSSKVKRYSVKNYTLIVRSKACSLHKNKINKCQTNVKEKKHNDN